MSTTHAARPDHDQAPVPGPSVKQQITRATAGTLATVAVLAVAALAFVYGAGPAVSLWWRIAGDPDLVLAEGFELPSEPPAAASLVWSAPTTTLEESLDVYAGPLGGGTLVRSAAELEALAPYAGDEIPGEDFRLGHVAVTPIGVLRLLEYGGGDTRLQLYGDPRGPLFATDQQQADLVARIGSAWLAAAGSTLAVPVVPWREPAMPDTEWVAGVQVPGCDVCFADAFNVVRFDESGRVAFAVMQLIAVVGTQPLEVVSAAEAFDAARHRRDGADAYAEGGPITSSRLKVGDLYNVVVTDEGLRTASGAQAYWSFENAEGTSYAAAPAAARP